MGNPKQLKILKQGVIVWNEWRDENPDIEPDLKGANLTRFELTGADLINVNLESAILNGANLTEANLTDSRLSGAVLTEANLTNADLFHSNLNNADLYQANLSNARLVETKLNNARLVGSEAAHANFSYAQLGNADFSFANIHHANFSFADLSWTNFCHSSLNHATFTEAILFDTLLGDTNFDGAINLDSCIHRGPSIITIDTLEKSGALPLNFLRGCGLPDILIEYIPSLLNNPIQFFSCFISYSHKDEEFAYRLYSRMREANLRVWYAPEEMKGGRKLHEQIFSAIQVHDKLLLVLSEHSLRSEWVMTEIRRARKTEGEENRRKLFPIKLVDFEAIQKWECFDAESGKDLGVELREYFIPDFSNWKDHDSFEKAFDRLLRDLKAEDKQTAEG